MGRGEQGVRATTNGLLFGPRRERPTIWMQAQSSERAQAEVDRLLGSADIDEICAVLSLHDELDLSMAPQLQQLVAGLVRQADQGSLSQEGYSRMLGLIADKIEEDGSCPALEPLGPPLLSHALLHPDSSDDDLRNLVRIALRADRDNPLTDAVHNQLRRLNNSRLENSYELLGPRADALLQELKGKGDDRAQELYEQVLAERSSWPPRWWGRALEQRLYAGDSELLEQAQRWARDYPGHINYGPELAAADPQVRAGLEGAVRDWMRQRTHVVSAGLILDSALEDHQLTPLDEAETKALEQEMTGLVDQFAHDMIHNAGRAEEKSNIRHRQLLTEVLIKRIEKDIDHFCDHSLTGGGRYQEKRQQLHQLLQQRRLLPDHSLSDVVSAEDLRAAVSAGFSACCVDNEPFCGGFSDVAFIGELVRQARDKQGPRHV